tara:strand:- start:3163 stop:4674 length:1512 start_codon:yes stop_codon:yes gene_type:complete
MTFDLMRPLELDHFIDGRWMPSTEAARLGVVSPATGECLGCAPKGSRDDVRAAVDAAHRAFQSGIWADLDPLDRARVMRRMAEALEARIEEFAALDARVTGRPIKEMRAQLSRLPEWLYHFAGIAKGLEGSTVPFKGNYLNYTQFSPLGVVGLISSWNHPLLIFLKKAAVALAAGNSVVAKPSELAPFSPLLFAELAFEAGLPAGVLNVVAGDGAIVGKALCEAPEVTKLDLTGGNATGRIVAGIAAERLIPCTMELGGKAPLLIFEDTPVDEAVRAALFASFVASGQTCVSGARILVQHSIHDEFVKAFSARAKKIQIGHPMSEDSQMGPVISARQKDRALGYVERAVAEGASIVSGGEAAQMPEPLSCGHYIAPTIIDGVTSQMEIWQDELFAPVVCVTSFNDEAEALALANDHQFGLGASVWTRDVGRAHRVTRKLQSGIVWINDHHKNDPASIWGGFGASGYGKENGWAALRSYMKEQNVVVRLDPGFPDWYGDETRYG